MFTSKWKFKKNHSSLMESKNYILPNTFYMHELLLLKSWIDIPKLKAYFLHCNFQSNCQKFICLSQYSYWTWKFWEKGRNRLICIPGYIHRKSLTHSTGILLEKLRSLIIRLNPNKSWTHGRKVGKLYEL